MSEEANRKSIAAYTMVQSCTPTPTLSPQTLHPQNVYIWNTRRHHAAHDYSRQWTAAILCVVCSTISSVSNSWAGFLVIGYVHNQLCDQSDESDLLKFIHNQIQSSQIRICSDASEKNLNLRTDFLSHANEAWYILRAHPSVG